MYLRNEIITSRNDMKKFWSNIKTLTTDKSRTQALHIMNIDANISGPEKIAASFNNYFCSIAKKLAENFKNTFQNYSSYMPKKIKSSMFLRPTSITEIVNTI